MDNQTLAETTTESTATGATAAEQVQTNATQETAAETAVDTSKLAADLARLKAANDKLSKENAEKNRILRAKQTEEEIKLQEDSERQATMQQRLEELEREKAVSDLSRRLVPVADSEADAAVYAEYLHGAADPNALIDAINKSWALREKKLRLEFGKIPKPDAGVQNPTMTKEQLDAMSYADRVRFKTEDPNGYNKLMKS